MATKRWRIMAEARLFLGLAVFLAVAAPWHILMAKAHPGFFDFYFIHEHFTRFTTDEAKRVQPWWFFVAITIAGMLPWTGLLIPTLKRVQPKEPMTLFLLLWAALPFLFFSASHSKLAPYIFPIFPPLAILLGKYLFECWEQQNKQTLRRNILFIIALFGAMLAVYFLMPLPQDEAKKLALGSLKPVMLLPVMVGLVGLLYVVITKRPVRKLIGALALFGVAVDISANYAIAALDHATTKPLVALLERKLKDGDMVVSYGTYFQDVPIYLNRNITVAGYTGELNFGVTHYPETHGWMISGEEFWKRCAHAKQPVYVFMKKTTLDATPIPHNCRLQPVAEYGKTVLLERQPK